VEKVKDIIKVGDEIEARVIKVDKVERRIGLSIKAVGYSEEQLKKESASFESLRPSSEMVGLEQAFNLASQPLPKSGVRAKNDPPPARKHSINHPNGGTPSGSRHFFGAPCRSRGDLPEKEAAFLKPWTAVKAQAHHRFEDDGCAFQKTGRSSQA